MSEQTSTYIGKKFSCPGCKASLKFRRPPKRLLQTCPHCRRKLRLQYEAAAQAKDDLVREAIELLVNSRQPVKKAYDYTRDPLLDNVDESEPGILRFDQPWPKTIEEVVIENAEVVCHRLDEERALTARKTLLSGKFKRVTVFRTGQVEQMEVTGHWWDHTHHESKLGLLERKIVRELNRRPLARNFAARINHVDQIVKDRKEWLKFYVDLAIDKHETTKPKAGPSFR